MYAKFIVVLVVIAIVTGPIKVSSARIKRQGWVWDDVATGVPPVLSTTTATPVVTTPSGPTTTTLNPTTRNCITRCITTNEYNPVCGTNRMTYDNPNKLKCAAGCGVRVQINFMGTCSAL